MSIENKGLDRRGFIIGTAAGLALGTSVAKAVEDQNPAKSQRPKPNVIVYIADQFRADFIGANGQNYTTKTPNLDAMATRGTYFSGAICNQPVCSPSRSVLMTGR